jgi:phosphoribosyl 1,2-cyclic phosphodiesterase
MHLQSLGSGSCGNACLVVHDGQALLIDAGISRRRIVAGLGDAELLAVLITHRHGDHLGPAAWKLGAPVWLDAANAREAARHGQLGDGVRQYGGAPLSFGPFRVTPVPLPHPGGGRWTSHGFLIECGPRRIAYATDLGHVPARVADILAGADLVFLESNHDPDLELASGRPAWSIDWVLSDHGHLSNAQCAEALSRIRRAHTVVLGHLSEDCNRPALALSHARRALPPSSRVVVAPRKEPSEPLPA